MNNQRGLALLLSLIVLVVAALLGLSSFQSSLLEERMAGNYRFSVSALQTAEAGVEDMIGYVMVTYSPDDDVCGGVSEGAEPNGLVGFDQGPHVFDSSGGLARSYVLALVCENQRLVGYSRGWVHNTDEGELAARKLRVQISPPGYNNIQGMLSEECIDLNGQSHIVGSVHSNTCVDLRIQDVNGNTSSDVLPVGSITSSGTVTLNNTDISGAEGGVCLTSVCASSSVPKMTIPSARDRINFEVLNVVEGVSYELGQDYLAYSDILSSFVSTAQTSSDFDSIVVGEGEGAQAANINLNGDPKFNILPYSSGKCDVSGASFNQSGEIYYCPGNLDIIGDFGGVTVIAEGNLTHRGESSIGVDREVETFVISGGNITLNGTNKSDSLYAVYMAEGNFTQNGNATIYGSIVAGGLITGNGGISFEARDSDFILVPVPAHFRAWDEVENPGEATDFVVGL